MIDLNFRKVDLHLHLDGSLRISTLYELAIQNNRIDKDMPLEEFEKLCRVKDDCGSLADFLSCFDLPLKLMQGEENLYRMAYELVETLAIQNLCYAEIRFAPQYHSFNGLSQSDVVECVLKGIKDACRDYPSLEVGLILCMILAVGYDNEKENRETIQVTHHYLGKGVVALDLAGAEGYREMSEFEELFMEAKKLNIPYTIHAGESGPAKNVLCALSFSPKRIGHGQAAIYDIVAVDKLKELKVPIELCVTSNVQCHVCPSFVEHPIRKLYEAGVIITVNTDNMTISDTTLVKEYEKLVKYYRITREELIECNVNSINASFMPEENKQRFIDEIRNS